MPSLSASDSASTDTSPPNDARCDVAVVGGGIVGLATARELLLRRPGLRVTILEREHALATQQTGHNSGVIHSGVYYAPGSLKARLCVAGRRALVAFCEERGVPYRICGKVIVALREDELSGLQAIYDRGRANGVEDLAMVDGDALREIEPHAAGLRAIHVGCTGVVDFRAVASALGSDVVERGGTVHTGCEVRSVTRQDGGLVLHSDRGALRARRLIACGGLFSDRLAALGGAPADMRVVPFRGDYYVLKAERAHLCKTLIYPVPDPSFPFLGVHFTRKIDGTVWAGPNAVLAGARQGYDRWDVNLRDMWEVLTWPGFWKLAARFWRTGAAEMWRDFHKAAYVRTMQAYVPEVRAEDVTAGAAGVRAQVLDRAGRMVDDFNIFEAPDMIHVRNAPSPAATSCLAIAQEIADRAAASFSL